MRKTILTSVCAAAIALSSIAAASAQTAGAPANNQTNVTGPAKTDNGSMQAMNKVKKKSKKKADKSDAGAGMEKNMEKK